MPPRAVKRGGGTPGVKKVVKGPRASARALAQAQSQAPPPVETPPEKVEEEVLRSKEEVLPTKVEVKEEEPVKPVVEEIQTDMDQPGVNGVTDSSDFKEESKEVSDEDEKGERLELEDNEPESEPEEDAGVDYDERGIEHDDIQEEEEVMGGEEEGDVEEVEEGDGADEEMEDGGEDVEGEGEDEEVEEERDEVADREEEEHHEVVKERRKRKEFEVFVGGLDKEATEEDLLKVFSEVGEVAEVRLMMNLQTKKNKGFAFIRFATVEHAKRAVTELKNPVVNGKQCGVSPSQDSDTLFLGNICKTWTKEALKEKLKHYGIENIEDMTLVEDSNNEGMNRGFAFLEFASRSEAMEAYKRLQKRDVVFGTDRTAKVAFADSFIEPDDEIMAQVKTVFIDGIPPSWDEDRVKELLKKFGDIEKVELARNMPSAKRNDFGFVTFDTHDAAVACVEGINNAELGEGDSKVKVRARLSRPHQRGRVSKRGARGDFKVGRGGMRGAKAPWAGRGAPRLESRRFPARVPRGLGGRGAPIPSRALRRPLGFRDRRPVAPVPPERVRHLPPPGRSYDRRPPVPPYPKSSKRDHSRRDDLPPPRSRAAPEFVPRAPVERRPSYRDDYPSRGSAYSDSAPRSASRGAARRPYPDEGYGRRLDRPPSYREGRGREYDSISGSKRPYSSLSDATPRYADTSVRHSRARLDYGVGGGASQYGDGSFGETARLGRGSHLGYGGSSRSSISGHDSHGMYDSRHGMGYGGSVSNSEVGGMYSSSYGSDYLPGGPDVGSGSYSSIYSSRGLSGGYMGGSGSGSYY
ncbi:nucleolin [Amborella trichopoda]|uniref:RRM domain-containing protein n=1 Tax=Amborella trichopoda TaxID=13333 RepID=W1NTY8_AMBTC|nr:nucleolin [Amborella trichopoda]ERN01072.1 hypothetical protein AMTR_s00002p00175460 [Amborella trichopoda]|eukprot:XP_006838503.1 nucleolin [Amborella trichopoda]